MPCVYFIFFERMAKAVPQILLEEQNKKQIGGLVFGGNQARKNK
jgi:hypothetical protein